MKIRYLAALLALALSAFVPALGSNFTRPLVLARTAQSTIPPGSNSGTLSAGNSGTTVASIVAAPFVGVRLTAGAQTVIIDVRTASSWSGNLTFGITVDGVDLTVIAPTLTNLNSNASGSISGGVTGTWMMTIPGGCTLFCYGTNSWAGSATVTVVGGLGAIGGSGGGGGSSSITSPLGVQTASASLAVTAPYGNLLTNGMTTFATANTAGPTTTVTTSPAVIVTYTGSALSPRRTVLIANTGTNDVWVGTTSGSPGWVIPAGSRDYVPMAAGVTLYWWTLTGTGTCTPTELFDMGSGLWLLIGAGACFGRLRRRSK